MACLIGRHALFIEKLRLFSCGCYKMGSMLWLLEEVTLTVGLKPFAKYVCCTAVVNPPIILSSAGMMIMLLQMFVESFHNPTTFGFS